jgi:hypothetical protein
MRGENMTILRKVTAFTAMVAFSLPTMAQQQKPSAAKAAPEQREEVAQPQQSPTLTQPAQVQQGAQNLALPMGTAVKMKLETILSTIANKAGDPFAGRVVEDVSMNGQVVIPVGSSIQGHVVRVSSTRRYKGLPALDLRPESVTTPDGQKYTLNAVVVDTDPSSGTKVNDEGTIQGEGMDRRDKIEVAGGAAGGAIMGGLMSGAKGSLVGAVVGGAAATVYWLSKHKSATLQPGTEIVMELSRPMTLNAAAD